MLCYAATWLHSHHHHQYFLRPVAHRARTKDLHSALLLAGWISAQPLRPNSILSLSTKLHHVSFGLPLLLFPGGVQLSAIFLSSEGSPRRTCPIHSHLRPLIMLVADGIPACLWSSTLVAILGQNIFKILLKHLLCKAVSLSPSRLLTFQNSPPHIKTDDTLLLYNRSFVPLLYWFDAQTALILPYLTSS